MSAREGGGLSRRVEISRLVAGVLLILFGDSLAQGPRYVLRGTVADSSTGERIPYATVRVAGTPIGGFTNSEGYFIIPRVPADSREILVSAIGYRMKSFEIAKKAGIVEVTFSIPAEPTTLSPVEVTGRYKGLAKPVAPSTTILYAEDVAKVTGIFSNDLLQAVTQLPGIVTLGGITSQYYVRGGSADQNLVTVDGIRVHNLFHAFGLFSFIDPLIVKVADMNTGGYQAEYGGRLSSILSVETKDGDKNKYALAGNIDLISSDLVLGGPLPLGIGAGKTSFLTFFRTALYENSLNRFFGRSLPFSFFDGFGKITTDFTSSGHASIEFLSTGDEISSDNPGDPNFRWRDAGYSLNASYLFSDQYRFDFSVTTSVYNAEQIPKTTGFTHYELCRITDPAFRGNLAYFAGDETELNFGLLFNFPLYEAEFTNAYGNTMRLSRQEVEPNMWAKYRWPVTRRLKAEVGLRLDISRTFKYASYTGKGYLADPRLTLSYQLTPESSVYFAGGLYHQRIISLTNEDDIYSPFDLIFAIPDTASNLDDESAYHYVIGTQFAPSNLTKAKAEIYYKDFTNLLAVNRDKVDQSDPDFVPGTGKAYGVEATFEYDGGDLYFSANYSHAKVTKTSGGITYEPRYGRSDQLNLSIGWAPILGLWMRARWEYCSGLPYTPLAGYYPQLALDPDNLSGYLKSKASSQIIFGAKNSARMSPYHRLDLSLSYDVHACGVDLTPRVMLVNVYNRMNVFYINNVSGDVEYSLPFIVNFSVSWRI